MGERRTIRAVLFDLGGTLLDFHDFASYDEVAREVGLSSDPEAIAEALQWATVEYDRPNPPRARRTTGGASWRGRPGASSTSTGPAASSSG